MGITTTLPAASGEQSVDDVDAQLVRRCLEGDARALQQLYEQNVAAVYRMVRLNGGIGASADDLVQDTFVRALELLPRFRGDARLTVWMRGIALNLCRTQRRKAWRRTLLRRRVRAPENASRAAESECRVELQQLLMQLERLPNAEREAFVLCRIEQLSLADAAAITGVSKSTLGDRVQRADAKLRIRLEGGATS